MGDVRAPVFKQKFNKLFFVFPNRQVLLHLLWKLLVMTDDGTRMDPVLALLLFLSHDFMACILIVDKEYVRGVVGCDSVQYAL